MARRKKVDDYVEIDIDVPSFMQNQIWARWRYSQQHNNIPFTEFREKYILAALEEKVWLNSPKIITAGTDGSIRIEAI